MTSTHVQLRNANSHERQKLFYTSERFDSLPIASLVPPISAALARQDARNPQVVKGAMSRYFAPLQNAEISPQINGNSK